MYYVIIMWKWCRDMMLRCTLLLWNPFTVMHHYFLLLSYFCSHEIFISYLIFQKNVSVTFIMKCGNYLYEEYFILVHSRVKKQGILARKGAIISSTNSWFLNRRNKNNVGSSINVRSLTLSFFLLSLIKLGSFRFFSCCNFIFLVSVSDLNQGKLKTIAFPLFMLLPLTYSILVP